MDFRKEYELTHGESIEARKERLEKLRLEDPVEFKRRRKEGEKDLAEIKKKKKSLSAKFIKVMRQFYNLDKDPSAAVHTVYCCLKNNFKIPKWCREAFVAQYQNVVFFKARTWDDVFGPLHPKGKHVSPMQRFTEFGLLVYTRVNMLHEIKGRPIDGAMFEEVGKDFGIGGKTTTEKIYYMFKTWVEMNTKIK